MKRALIGFLMLVVFSSQGAGAGTFENGSLPSMRTANVFQACRTQAERVYPEVQVRAPAQTKDSKAVECKLTDAGLTCTDSSKDSNEVQREELLMDCARAALS